MILLAAFPFTSWRRNARQTFRIDGAVLWNVNRASRNTPTHLIGTKTFYIIAESKVAILFSLQLYFLDVRASREHNSTMSEFTGHFFLSRRTAAEHKHGLMEQRFFVIWSAQLNKSMQMYFDFPSSEENRSKHTGLPGII
jgi:hypothetical protein